MVYLVSYTFAYSIVYLSMYTFCAYLVRTHYNEYTKTIRISQCLCIHKSTLSLRSKYTFPIQLLKYTISIQKYTFSEYTHPSFLPFSYTSLSTHNCFPSHPIVYTLVAYWLYTHMNTSLCVYTQQLHTICIHSCIPNCVPTWMRQDSVPQQNTTTKDRNNPLSQPTELSQFQGP